MCENKEISIKKERYDTSTNSIKNVISKSINAIVNIKTKLDNALGPELKEVFDELVSNLCLFDGPKLIFNIKQKRDRRGVLNGI